MSYQHYRRPVQAFFLLLSVLALSAVAKLCPLNGLQQLAGSVAGGMYAEALGAGTILGFPRLAVVVGGFVVFIVVFGRVWCGWVCPFGTLMGAADALNLPVSKREPPVFLQSTTFKYELLAVFVGAAMVFGYPVFCQVCPAGALYRAAGTVRLSTGLLPSLSVAALAFLFVAVYHRRYWCSAFCPLGALAAILDRVSAFRILVSEETCVGCLACQRECPMDVLVIEDSIRRGRRTVPTGECIRCGRCIDACPTDSLSFSFKYG